MTIDETEISDVVFAVLDLGLPTTEYQVTETVLKNSGEGWIGLALELGFGMGAGFVPSAMGDDLDSDAPDYDSPLDIPPFANITCAENDIDAFDVFILDGDSQTFTSALDVPVGITEFTIRHRGRALPVPEASPTWGGVKTLFR